MARALSSYSAKERAAAITRRLQEGEAKDGTVIGGLGYWAARDARRNHGGIAGPATPRTIS